MMRTVQQSANSRMVAWSQRSTEIVRLKEWMAEASRFFMESYLTRLQEKSSDPMDAATATRIVQFFLIEKALYEVLYESVNRPTWTSIPLQYVVSQFAEMKQSPTPRGAR